MKKEKYDMNDQAIQEYTFMNFMDSPETNGKIEEYGFSGIEDAVIVDQEEKSELIRDERDFAKAKNFTISPITREYRGIDEQIEHDKELRIKSEVDRRLIKLHEEATFKGYNEGIEKGKQDIYEQTRNSSEEKIALLTNMISDVLQTRENLMEKQRLDIYETIRNLTKWVLLRELKEDGEYITRLLEKLILEIHTKSDLVIHIDQKNFENMPDVLETLKGKLGELSNVRVEIDYDIEGPGIILDSRNGIINGSLKEQFHSIDELFSNLDLPFSHEFTLLSDMKTDESNIPFKGSEDIETSSPESNNEEE